MQVFFIFQAISWIWKLNCLGINNEFVSNTQDQLIPGDAAALASRI